MNNEKKMDVSEKEEMKSEEINSNRQNLIETMRQNPWMVSTLVLGVLVLIFLVGSFGMTGNVVNENDVGQAILDFADAQGVQAELVGVEETDYFYEVTLSIDGSEIPLYVTKDGKSFTSALIPLSLTGEKEDSPENTPTEVVKSDKPKVELFVMTHCPYGTQAEKGFIPFMEAMGNLVDAKIRFVHYFMHDPEETETPRQVCIREEQSDKYLAYLREFLIEGDSDAALTKANIDVAKMEKCIENGNAEKYYAEDSELSNKYGVRGSPTLVVNGVQVSAGRSPDAYLQAACSAFNTAPTECSSLELSSTSPAPMWGWDESGSATTAQC